MNNTNQTSQGFFKQATKKLSEITDDGVARLEKLTDRHFCLGITGLSQSGKSTFITSLINQLLEHKKSKLPGFSPALSGRLLAVKIHPLKKTNLPQFPYDESFQGIASPNPQWPKSTTDISGCLLELKLSRNKNKLSFFSRDQFSLYLEIRDYPGEWLLDLPLREMSYSRWCSQCSAQYTQSPRAELLGDLLHDLQKIDPLAEVDYSILASMNARYMSFLKDCKYSGKSLSLIQPGRFLIPGEIPDTDILCFIPLLKVGSYTEGQLTSASTTSYFKVCEQRYKRYIKELVDPFYKDFFSRIDRQLVLVDVIKALNSGPEYIDDMRQALANITDSFAYGKQNRLLQLFRPKIDKVVFAATKIDQVIAEDHESVRQLLSVIVKLAYENAQYEGIDPSCEAVAAIRSSKELECDGDRGISGFSLEGRRIGYIHPTIPARIPEGDEWDEFLNWDIHSLIPPKGLSYQNSDAIPHIRLDSILNALIGDKCV